MSDGAGLLVEQVTNLDAQRTGDADECGDGGVGARAFEILPVLLIEPPQLRCPLLREPLLIAELPDATSKPT